MTGIFPSSYSEVCIRSHMKLCGCFYSPTTLQSGPLACLGNSISTFKSPSTGVSHVYSSTHRVHTSLLHRLQNGVPFHMAESEQLKGSLFLIDLLLCLCATQPWKWSWSFWRIPPDREWWLPEVLPDHRRQPTVWYMLLFIPSMYLCRK